MPIVKRGPKVAKIIPFGEQVIVAPAKPKDQIGGIIIPEDAQRPQIYGRIVSRGAAVPETYGVGDIVLFSQYAGLELELEDVPGVAPEKVLVVPYKQLLAKVVVSD
jgi:co-chaperonin GroES (HSP10)